MRNWRGSAAEGSSFAESVAGLPKVNPVFSIRRNGALLAKES